MTPTIATRSSFAWLLWLPAVVAAQPAVPVQSAECRSPAYESPGRQVVCAAGGDVGRAAAALRRRFGLAAAPAASLARTTLHAVELAKRQQANEPGPGLAELRAVERGYLEALRATSADADVIADLRRFVSDWRWDLREPSAALAAYVARSPDPASLALKLTREAMDSESYSVALLLAAARARPAPAALWQRAADLSAAWTALRLAFLERAAAAAGAGEAEFAERRVRELLSAGLAGEALAVFDRLPPGARERLLAGQDGAASEGRARPHSDLRLELAVARSLTGDPAGGRALLERVPKPPAETAGIVGGATAPDLDARAVPRLFVAGDLAGRSGRDLFPVLAAVVARQAATIPYETDRDAFARLAERAGYPAFAASVLPSTPWEEDPSSPEPAPLPPEVARAAQRLHALLAGERGREMAAQAVARDAARAGLGSDPAAASAGRYLAREVSHPFAERRLPPGLPPAPPPAGETSALARALRLPAGHTLVRVERAGRRAAAIVEGAPDGSGAGDYSIALSADGGATWSRPFGTGLHRHEPYVVRPASALPLLAGDRLQVEVERVPDTAPFRVPGGYRSGPGEPGFYLEIALADLTRDRDGDGATDLEEESLRFTDPDDPDTDRDGLSDGADPLPLVPAAPAGTASRAVAALINHIAASAHPGVSVAADAPIQASVPLTSLPQETLYVVADRPLLAGLTARRRIVVVASEEVAAVERRRHPFNPVYVHFFALDRERRHAAARWSSLGEGGTVWLEERGGVWTPTDLGRWIS